MITHTEFHSDQLRHLSNITAITTTIWEALNLVLQKKGFVEKAAGMDSCGTIYISDLM
jgi:hypothetical protein